jgi:cell division protein ZapA
MAQVDVQVNGRTYALICDEGEQDHLRALAQDFDKRMSDLASSVGTVADARLMLMAGLMLTDELKAALSELAECKRQFASLEADRAFNAESAAKSEDALTEILKGAAQRIESIAAGIARA